MDPILYWNDVALEANRADFSKPTGTNPEQGGPTLSSRALAIVHLAMYDAFAGASPADNLNRYTSVAIPAGAMSPEAAVATAAHRTLSQLFPSQQASFNARLAAAVFTGTPAAITLGRNFGVDVANALLAARAGDPGAGDGGYAASNARRRHRPDPDNTQGFHAPFYGAMFGTNYFLATQKFVLDDINDPTKYSNSEHTAALKQVREKGIAPELVGTLPNGSKPRTPEETLIGIYWGYDGANDLGTPPRLYNQIVRKVAEARGNSPSKNACLFALINGAMADAGVMAWEQKYVHDFWRPVVGIREHDESMGPISNIDVGNISGNCDPFWLPLGAPNSNREGKNFTPPFPAYPSGHATFGAAALHTTRLFYGLATSDRGNDMLGKDLKNDPTGNTNLVFVSDELNGVTKDCKGTTRPRHARSFPGGLMDMIVENAISRIYLGVHWVFDAFATLANGAPDYNRNIGGVPLGLNIAENIYNTSPLSQQAHPAIVASAAVQKKSGKK